MNKKIIYLIGMFLLIGSFGIGSVLAIDNFNISSSISSEPLLFLNGKTGYALFEFDVSEENFEKIYKLSIISFPTSSDTRFIFPGDLRVAGCFHFSRFLGGVLW